MTSDLFHVYDTTLRDGAQQEGLNLSVADKLAIAAMLDDLGVDYVEGGYPGANPTDAELFSTDRKLDRLLLLQREDGGWGGPRPSVIQVFREGR